MWNGTMTLMRGWRQYHHRKLDDLWSVRINGIGVWFEEEVEIVYQFAEKN